MAELVADMTLYEMFFYIIGAWIVVDSWQRLIESLMTDKFGMNLQSAYHNFIIAFVLLGIFLILITIGNTILRNLSPPSETYTSLPNNHPSNKDGWSERGVQQADCCDCAWRFQRIRDNAGIFPPCELCGRYAGSLSSFDVEEVINRNAYNSGKPRHSPDYISKVDRTQFERGYDADLPQDFLVVRRRRS